MLRIVAQLVSQSGMMHNPPVELPAAHGSETVTQLPAAAAASLFLIYALAAETVLLDSTDMK